MSNTKEENSIDDYLLKLIGKAALPEPIEVGDNYKVVISGSVTEKREKDRNDGGRIYTWIFEPVIVEIINSLGKTLKTKDTRSDSKLWKSQLYAMWKERKDVEMNDEEFYHFVNSWLRRNADELVERALRTL